MVAQSRACRLQDWRTVAALAALAALCLIPWHVSLNEGGTYTVVRARGSPNTAGAAAEGAAPWPPSQRRSFYAPWIDLDLSAWAETGITQQMVDHAFTLARLCSPAAMRVQLISGSLWVDGFHNVATDIVNNAKTWGPGWADGYGRQGVGLATLMEVVRMFPEIPDLDLVLNLADYPCITELGTTYDGKSATPPWISSNTTTEQAAKEAAAAGFVTEAQRKAAAAPPILGHNGRRGYTDIPFPDYTYFKTDFPVITEGAGWALAWEARLSYYLARWTSDLASRSPQLIWRGRTDTARDQLRRTYMACHAYLASKNLSQLIDLSSGVDPITVCQWRYQGYLESNAWSTSLKNKLACGSVVMSPVMQYYEFYSRAMKPGVHYIEMSHDASGMCEDIARNVAAMNAWLDGQKAMLRRLGQREKEAAAEEHEAGPGEVSKQQQEQQEQNQAKQQEEQEEREREQQLALEAMRVQGIYGYPPKKSDKRYRHEWDSDLLPTEIAQNGRQFLVDHVRRRDVYLYMRDLLQQYAKLQRFKPQPQPQSGHYSGIVVHYP